MKENYTVTGMWDDFRPICKRHGCELILQEHNNWAFYVCPESMQSDGYHNERIPIFVYTDFIDAIAKQIAEEDFLSLDGKIMRSKNFTAQVRRRNSSKYNIIIDFSKSR